MANTGRVLTTVLEDVIPPCPSVCTPLGHTKPNIPTDPDYIEPEYNTSLCPVTSNTECPKFVATAESASIVTYEMNVPNSVINNPAIDFVKVSMTGGPSPSNQTFSLPFSPQPNYKLDTAILIAGTYNITIEYLSPSSTLVASCPNIATVTVT